LSENSIEHAVLVSSAEFILKSSPVRRMLEQRLVDDLRFVLRRTGLRNFIIGKSAGRMIISRITAADAATAAQTVAKIFGVAYATPAARVSGSKRIILSALLQMAAHTIAAGQTFAIRCHQSSASRISTRDVEREGGSEILRTMAERNLKVDLSRPDVLFSIDLVGESAYLYTKKIAGPGGLPLSSRWKMLAVLDSGPLSLFAAYAMMRRGCLVQLLIPSSSAVQHYLIDRQLKLASKLRQFVTRERYVGFVTELDKSSNSMQKEAIRLMALEIARRRRFRGIILADVSGSIALPKGLGDKSREVGIPVFQPLIGFEADDLTELCRLFDINLSDLQLADDDHEPSESINHLNWAEFPVIEISL